jgi:hypothetical protein
VRPLDAAPQISGFWKLKLADCDPLPAKSPGAFVTMRNCAHPTHNSGYLLFHCSFNEQSKSNAPLTRSGYSPAAWLLPPPRQRLSVTGLYFQWATASAGLDRRQRHANLECPERPGWRDASRAISFWPSNFGFMNEINRCTNHLGTTALLLHRRRPVGRSRGRPRAIGRLG